MEVKEAATHTERPVHMPKPGVAISVVTNTAIGFGSRHGKKPPLFGARVDEISEPFVAVLLSGAKVS